MREGSEVVARFDELRGLYEPYAQGLAGKLLLPLPSWFPAEETRENWFVPSRS